MIADARGTVTSATDRRSLDGYEAALWQLNHYRGDPISTIDAALAEDPDFVMGHAFRAMAMLTMWERSVLPEVQRSLDRLEALANRANDRERGLIAAVRRWCEGDWDGLATVLDRHLIEHPTDLLALQVGHLSDFMHGDRDNLRTRIERAIPAWDKDMPGYACVLGMHAFGLEESYDFARAEARGREALALDPDDGWAHHAVAHVMEMRGRSEEGITWMRTREPYWAHSDNTFAFHNFWHWALYHLDQGDAKAALALYDRGVKPGASPIQVELIDAASMLWRMHLQGIDTGERWAALVAAYEAAAASAAGFYVFNDMHAMMAMVASGRMAAADRLLVAVERSMQDGGSNAVMTRAVGLAMVRAVHAFGHGRYAETVDLLWPVRYRAHVFGGSHAQRDVIHRTLLEAAQRDGQISLAEALVAERIAAKPDCPFARREQQRAQQSVAMTAKGMPAKSLESVH